MKIAKPFQPKLLTVEAFQALIVINVEIKNQIIEDDQVTDTLLRKYLQGNSMSV